MNWKPIETAPKDGTRVLGYKARNKANPILVVKHCNRFGGRWLVVKGGAIQGLTHWQPLPAPPEHRND